MIRQVFYDAVRPRPFPGVLTTGQVQGTEALLDAWALSEGTEPPYDPNWIAYSLATVFWETGAKMLPVEEIGHGKGKAYGVADPVTQQIYYGRGPVQLTWKTNYARLGALLNLDLLNHPELMLVPEHGARATVLGMIGGLFTGRALKDYFTLGTAPQPVQARRIINGVDHALDIASLYDQFKAALVKAGV
jgi:hypothetical protein